MRQPRPDPVPPPQALYTQNPCKPQNGVFSRFFYELISLIEHVFNKDPTVCWSQRASICKGPSQRTVPFFLLAVLYVGHLGTQENLEPLNFGS